MDLNDDFLRDRLLMKDHKKTDLPLVHTDLQSVCKSQIVPPPLASMPLPAKLPRWKKER